MTNDDTVWLFALRAIELAVESIPDPIARAEASAQLGLALHHARSLAPADGDPPTPAPRRSTYGSTRGDPPLGKVL